MFEQKNQNTKLKVILYLSIFAIVVVGLTIFFTDKYGNNLNNRLEYFNLEKSLKEQKNYEESKKENLSLIANPNIPVKEVKDKYVKPQSEESENHIVIFNGSSFDPSEVEIKIGDIVTWINKSENPIKIIGTEWESLTEIAPNKKYSQEFDFVGEYKYTANRDTKLGGVVKVVKEK